MSFVQSVVSSLGRAATGGGRGGASRWIRHEERRIIRTDPHHLLSIIVDVDRYSEFLPYCRESRITRRLGGTPPARREEWQDASAPKEDQYEAILTVGLSALVQERYTSRVLVNHSQLTVEAKSIRSQVLESLESRWKIHPLSPPPPAQLTMESPKEDLSRTADGKKLLWSRVEFEIAMSVKDPVMAATLDAVLPQVAQDQVEAFDRRCSILRKS